MTIERFIQPHYGPRFFRIDDKDFFENRIDSRNGIGPRIATKVDKENHKKQWLEHLASLTEEQNEKIMKKKRG